MNDTTFQADGKVAYVPVVVSTKAPKLTNADIIRSMTDEELADWLYNTVDDFPPWCDESRGHHSEAGGCEKCMVDWLKEEAE